MMTRSAADGIAVSPAIAAIAITLARRDTILLIEITCFAGSSARGKGRAIFSAPRGGAGSRPFQVS
jgi:hypothetical protein